MATTKHYSYLKVENFKCFESLEVKNIGQFNLIGGDNNVGKTSLLEALLFDENLKKLLARFVAVFEQKNTQIDYREIEYLDYFLKNNEDKAIKYIASYRGESDGYLYELSIKNIDNISDIEKNRLKNIDFFGKGKNNSIAVLEKDSILLEARFIEDINGELGNYMPYVYYGSSYNYDLNQFYSEHIQKNQKRKAEFIQSLAGFIPDIKNVEVVAEINTTNLYLSIAGIETLQPLSFFGEGSIKFFRILLAIYECANGYLLIDEVDAGIHYSRFKDYWRIILKCAQKNNVQIFATTHSLECMTYFKEVLEEEEMKSYSEDARYIALIRNKEDKVKSFTYTYPEFASNIDIPNEMR